MGLGLHSGGIAVDGQPTKAGLQQPAHELDEGGLARAVGPQQPHQFPPPDVQIHIGEGLGVGKGLAQPLTDNQILVHLSSSFQVCTKSTACWRVKPNRFMPSK